MSSASCQDIFFTYSNYLLRSVHMRDRPYLLMQFLLSVSYFLKILSTAPFIQSLLNGISLLFIMQEFVLYSLHLIFGQLMSSSLSSYQSSLHTLEQSFLLLRRQLLHFRDNFQMSGGGRNLVSIWLSAHGVKHLVDGLSLSHDCPQQHGNELSSEGKPPSSVEVNSSFYEQPNNFCLEVVNRGYTRGPYRSYTLEEKQAAVQMIGRGNGVSEVSRILQIPCKNIKRWIVQGTLRKKGGGRRSYSPKMEAETYEWIVTSFNTREVIHIEQIQAYALSRSENSLFKASRGWIKKFIGRFNLREKYHIM